MTFFSEITSASPLLLIGAGNMGGALLKGWLAAGVVEDAVIVVDPRGEGEIRKALGSQNLVVRETLADAGLAGPPRVIVFAVKPQFMADVFGDAEKANLALGNTLVLSVAAGIRIAAFEGQFGQDRAIVRAMPNTPAAIGKGISAITGNRAAGEQDMAFAEALMACVGEVVRVDNEDLIDAVTCLSGSGPAYFFHMVEAMTEAGIAGGLERDVAYRLSKQTFIGAAHLMEQSGEEAEVLRKRVTSPKGTTEAALSVLIAEGGLTDLMKKAVLKAIARAKELAS